MDLHYFNGNLFRISTNIGSIIDLMLSISRSSRGARWLPKLKSASEFRFEWNVFEVYDLFCILIRFDLSPDDDDYSENLRDAPHNVKFYLADLVVAFIGAIL